MRTIGYFLLLISCLMGLTVPASAEAASLEGIWMDPSGGIFTVKAGNGRLAWIGQGAKDGKYFLHKGISTIQGNTLQGEWIDLPESQFYPSEGKINGTVSADGLAIHWQDGKGFYREWVRHIDAAVSTAGANDGTSQPAAQAAGTSRPASWGDVAHQLQKGEGTKTKGQDSATGNGKGPQTWSEVSLQLQHPPRVSVERTGAPPMSISSQPTGKDRPTSAETWVAPGANAPPVRPGDDRLGGTATNPLSSPDPWNSPQVQQLIDEWLHNAKPVVRADLPGPWHFTEWAQVLGPGSQTGGAPDHPAGWSRHQSLWAKRAQFDSLNLCTMGEFVERRIAGKSLDGCNKAAPQEATSAWHAPASPPNKEAVSLPPPAPRPLEPARRPDDIVVSKPSPQLFTGDWDCIITNESGKTASANHRIIRDSAGNYILWVLGGEGQFPAKYVDGNRIGFVIGDGTTDKDVILDLEVNNNVAVGTDRIEYYDGRKLTYTMRCNRTGVSGGRK